jgi:hypothetical protein
MSPYSGVRPGSCLLFSAHTSPLSELPSAAYIPARTLIFPEI